MMKNSEKFYDQFWRKTPDKRTKKQLKGILKDLDFASIKIKVEKATVLTKFKNTVALSRHDKNKAKSTHTSFLVY